jgi:hypothetical protein
MRLTPALILTAAAALLWALIVYETDGVVFELAGIRVSSRSPRMPLAIAGLAFVLAWAHLVHRRRDHPPTPPAPRHPQRFLLLPLAAALTFNLLLMSGPMPPPGEDHCVFVVDLGARFHHYLNCDAPEFLALARDPHLVLGPNPIRQSRPLSITVPHLLAAGLRAAGWFTDSDPYLPLAPEYLSYAAINLATLFAALVAYTRVVERVGGAPGVELVFGAVILGVNELTKPFLLNPHTQMFNVFVPLLSVLLTMRLSDRGKALSPMAAAVIGLLLGVGTLWYGSFAVAALCASVVQLAIFRAPMVAIILGMATLVPYASWAGYVILAVGTFYNHEATSFRQFVWIADCARAGAEGCVTMLTIKSVDMWRASWPVLAAPVACIALLHVTLRFRGASPAASPHRLAYRRAMAITLGVIAVFTALIGYYVWRLSWMAVPPLVVVITLQMQALRRAWPALDGWRGVAAVIGLLIVWIGMLFARQGPYS